MQAYVETPIYARTAGYLKKWYVDIGGRVKTGELLATIDAPEVDEELSQAQAAEAQSQASVELAKSTSERWENLLKLNGVSQQEVDQNNSNYRVAQANLNAAKANVQRLKDLQSFQKVVAPFDGVLTARNVDIGALISDGNSQQLFRLAQIDTLRVYVNVPENYSNDVREGVPADLHIAEFPTSVFRGKVTHTSGAIDPTSRTLLTEVQVPNPKLQLDARRLFPGEFSPSRRHRAADHPIDRAHFPLFRSAGRRGRRQQHRASAHRSPIGRDFGTSLEISSGLEPGRRGHRQSARLDQRRRSGCRAAPAGPGEPARPSSLLLPRRPNKPMNQELKPQSPSQSQIGIKPRALRARALLPLSCAAVAPHAGRLHRRPELQSAHSGNSGRLEGAAARRLEERRAQRHHRQGKLVGDFWLSRS